MLLTFWKFRDVGYIIVILGLVVWLEGLKLHISGTELKLTSARIENQERADRLSDELVIWQARAAGANQEKAIQYVERIRTVVPNCPPDQGDRDASRGVRDLIRGGQSKTVSGTTTSVQGSGIGARSGNGK